MSNPSVPTCFENHHKYVGKCPYCHTKLPGIQALPAGESDNLIERLNKIVEDGDAYGTRAEYPTSIYVRQQLEQAASALDACQAKVGDLEARVIPAETRVVELEHRLLELGQTI